MTIASGENGCILFLDFSRILFGFLGEFFDNDDNELHLQEMGAFIGLQLKSNRSLSSSISTFD